MRHINVFLPPRRREYDIVVPSRLHESRLWIQNLAYKLKAYAVYGVLLGQNAMSSIVKRAEARTGLRVGATLCGAEKRIMGAVQEGIRLGNTAFAKAAKEVKGEASLHIGVRSAGTIVVLALRPLSDVDDDMLTSLDEMTLMDLDYMWEQL